MKKKIMLGMFLMISMFSSCGNIQDVANSQMTTVESLDNKNPKETISEEKEVEVVKEVIPISDQYEAVSYEGNLIICQVLNDESNLFLIGCDKDSGNYEVHKMKIGDRTSEKISVPIPDDMEIQRFTLDVKGNLHLFVTNKDKSMTVAEIMVVDQDGRILRTLDIYDAFPVKAQRNIVLAGFAIDEQERYYLSETYYNDRTYAGLVILDSEGKQLGIIQDKNWYLWGNREIARGDDGKVYILEIFRDAEKRELGDIALLAIDPENICIEKVYKDILRTNQGLAFGFSKGIKSDFYMINYEGVFAYNLGDKEVSELLKESDIPVSIKEQGDCNTFLEDGRLLIILGDLKTEEIPNGEDVLRVERGYSNAVFHYIPVE